MNYIIFCILFLSSSKVVRAQALPEDTVARKDSLLMLELRQAKADLNQLLHLNLRSYEINKDMGNVAYNLGCPQSVEISNDVVSFLFANNKTADIHLAEITDTKLKINSTNGNIQNGLSITEYKLKIGATVISVRNENLYLVKNILDCFRKIQTKWNYLHFEMNRFEQLASAYKASADKPAVTEEQRKYIVQADANVRLYNYEKAIQLNQKVVAIHPCSCQNAYLNLAILLAETNRLHSAIFSMKKFLLLNTNTADGQFAKNKIAEWETILNN